MLSDFVNTLKALTEEERKILGGDIAIQKDLYTSSDEFIIDSKKTPRAGKADRHQKAHPLQLLSSTPA